MKKLKQMSGPYSIGFELSSTAHGFVATDPNGNVLYHGKQPVIWVEYITRRLCPCSRKPVRMVVTLENKMFFNPLCLGQYKNEKVQMDSPKKKAVGEKIVVDAEDLLSIARDLESSSNIVHINGKEYTGKKSWIANRLREIVASAPINR